MKTLYVEIDKKVYRVEVTFETIESKDWMRCRTRLHAGMNLFEFYFFSYKNEMCLFKDVLEANSEEEIEKVLMIHQRIINSFRFELKTFLRFIS